MSITIVHATALTPQDEMPRQHALALVAAAGGRLWSVHATDAHTPDVDIPDVMDLMRSWAQARGVSTEEVGSVVHQRRLEQGAADPDAMLLQVIDELQPDLVVAGTRARRGLDLALMGSTAQALVRGSSCPVLLLPAGHPGFVDPDTGTLRLHKILIPAGDAPTAQAATDMATRLALLQGPNVGELLLVRVGDDADAPAIALPDGLPWGRRWIQGEGSVVKAVADVAEAEQVDLIVMATRGRDSVMDSLLGSYTERVLRRSPCALLVVPLR
ncbi:MAG: universal stress protein [Nannocystaceae bacterium]